MEPEDDMRWIDQLWEDFGVDVNEQQADGDSADKILPDFVNEQQADHVDSAVTDLLNKFKALGRFTGLNYLVQFWKAEVIDDSGKKRLVLSTRNQPFLIDGKDDGKVSLYRSKMVDIEIDEGGGADGGVIGRVFRNNRVECTPNTSYYQNGEYPFGDIALLCAIRYSLALPLSDPSGSLVGVLEMVANSVGYIPFMSCLAQASQQGSSLKYLDCCNHRRGQDYTLLDADLSKIDEVMKAAGANCGLLGAQTWILCKHCESLSISKSLAGMRHASYENDSYSSDGFSDAEYVSTLKKGEGVVGQAGTHNMVYCDDVSLFSITEYRLAHIDYDNGFNSCLAIRLKSNLTGSQNYVVELFLARNKLNEKGLKDTLISILEVMRQNFPYFEVGSGEETSSEDSYVLVIDAISPHKYQTVKICDLNAENMVHNFGKRGVPIAQYGQQQNNSKISSNKPGGELADGVTNVVSLQEGQNIGLLATTYGENVSNNNHVHISYYEQARVVHPSHQSPIQVDVHTEKNVTGPSVEISSPVELGKRRDGAIPISLEDLKKVSGMKRKEAAEDLGVSISTLKRVCREYKISRWPPREININNQSGFCNYAQTVFTKEGPATIKQNKSVVTIKAKYRGEFILFPLYSTSIDEFHRQVKKRLKIEGETYKIKFQDEHHDFILIGCDEDLHRHIYRSKLPGKTPLMLYLENVTPVPGSSHRPL